MNYKALGKLNQLQGAKSESYIERLLPSGFHRTPGSGAFRWKGDFSSDKIMIEAKSTRVDSFRVTTRLLNKIFKQADGKWPVLIVWFSEYNKGVALIPMVDDEPFVEPVRPPLTLLPNSVGGCLKWDSLILEVMPVPSYRFKQRITQLQEVE